MHRSTSASTGSLFIFLPPFLPLALEALSVEAGPSQHVRH